MDGSVCETSHKTPKAPKVIRTSAQMQINKSNIMHTVAKNFEPVEDFIT